MENNQLKHVVLLKAPKDSDDPYVTALLARGFSASCLPVLDVAYLSTPELTDALSHPQCYAGLIVTSQNAVEAVRRAMSPLRRASPTAADSSAIAQLAASVREEGVAEAWAALPTFVVGPATLKQARSVGLLNTVGEAAGNAAALADIILKHFDVPPPKPLLFPCGNLSDDALPLRLRDAGYTVEALTVYATAACADFGARWDAMIVATQVAMPSAVVFFSPSGVRFTLDHLRQLRVAEKAQMIAIGPSTEKELQSNGIRVSFTATKPEPESVADAIAATCCA